MSNSHYTKTQERKAFEELLDFVAYFLPDDKGLDRFRALLSTYRKHAFDGGVLDERERNNETRKI